MGSGQVRKETMIAMLAFQRGILCFVVGLVILIFGVLVPDCLTPRVRWRARVILGKLRQWIDG